MIAQPNQGMGKRTDNMLGMYEVFNFKSTIHLNYWQNQTSLLFT